ncbi:predicted protein [Aspergillus terreus NIH2624]|uniref:DUF6987 domain-containing protein n=1 Tax=Aspergillus terreus (strain NIH 2624 / FGSC A1156) TaxID=341663 RepID=Q0CZT4_ASPTN|nr:uncharacterized protein ATEG_00800 [Aspergillus terreus NIH2624]EAU39446.1 predicted protein [Aspergillus terreus NIH2624]
MSASTERPTNAEQTSPSLRVKEPAPVDGEKPSTPSNINATSEQRDMPSPAPEDSQSQASASGQSSGLFGKARGLTGNLMGTLQGVTKTGSQTVDNIVPLDLSILKGLEVGEGGQVLGKDGNLLGRLVEGNPADLVRSLVRCRTLLVCPSRMVASSRTALVRLLGNWWRAIRRIWLALPPTRKERFGTTMVVLSVASSRRPRQSMSSRTATNQSPRVLCLERRATPRKLKPIRSQPEEKEDLPPLSTLEGLKCNKLGKIISSTGKPVGELIEGDPKKLSRMGAQLDAKGQFWDNRGNVIGKAQTIPTEEHQDEPVFAGLEGLHVVEDGWVEDDKGKRVGKIVEGDAKKILGRPVDEDGEVTDQHGNVIAKADYWEAPDESEPEVVDLSHLNGLTPNKLGYVIGSNGVPIARVVEGNPKELAGKEIDDGQIWDGRKPIGRVELIPENEREKKPEGPFSGLDNLTVNKDGYVEDGEGNIVGQVTEGDAKALRGRAVDEDGDILDKFGSTKGHAERYEPPEEEKVEEDLSILEGKTVNKAGNVVDAQGTVFGRIVSGDKRLAGRKVDGHGQVWGDDGKVIGKAELIPGAERQKPEGPFYGFETAEVGKDGVVVDASGRTIGRVAEGDAKKLFGRKVDEDGDILDKNGNTIGRAERWEPEEKKRNVNPMAGRKVTREGEVRDVDGNLIGKLTSGNLATLIGKDIDDNGYVVDNDGNKLGECTLMENIPPEEPEEEPGPSPEEEEAQKKAEEDRQLAKKMSIIVGQTLDRMRPICKMISEHIEKAERTPKEELDEEKLVQNVKPLLEEGGSILQECNGAIRALDPDGQIAANAKARAASHEAPPEEYALADQLKELTDTVVRTVENGRKKIADMPHAKKKLNPLWGLLSEPLFQIIAAVGLLLSGVLGLVGRLLDGLGLGPLVNRLLGGLGLDKVLQNLGLGSLTDALGLTGKK